MFSRALYACGILYLNFVSPAVGSSQPDPKSKNHYEVLKLQRNCTVTQIKKAYRQLALELHPDKVRLSTRFGDLDMEMAKTMFLEVQNAYSVLAIPDRRKQYDLQLQGVEYEHYTEPEPDSRYMAAGTMFRMYVKTPSYQMVFEMKNPDEPIPPINVDIKVSLADTLAGLLNKKHTFHRREICEACNGTGSKGGEVIQCRFCKGAGTANHLFAHPSGEFEQMTHTVCGVCAGAGFMPKEKCDVCAGKGVNIGENSFTFSLAAGFRSGYSFTVADAGHMSKDSRIGIVHATMRLELPDGWSIQPGSPIDVLHYTMYIPLQDILDGFSRDVYSPSGEVAHVLRRPVYTAANALDKRTTGNGTDSDALHFRERGEEGPEMEADPDAEVPLDVMTLLHGINFHFPELGVLVGRERGPMQVHVSCAFPQTDPLKMFELLEKYGVLAPLVLPVPGQALNGTSETGEEENSKEKKEVLHRSLQDRYTLLQQIALTTKGAEGGTADPMLARLTNFYSAHLINLEMRRDDAQGAEEVPEAEEDGAAGGEGISLKDFDFDIAPGDVQFDS